jgi:hypothetical protein
MVEVCLDQVKQAAEVFRDSYNKFKEYIKYIEENIPENKRTLKQKELVAKYGSK